MARQLTPPQPPTLRANETLSTHNAGEPAEELKVRIKGYEIEQSAIDAAIARMKHGEFRFNDIWYVLTPLTKSDSYRLADRLIQRERKAGNIEQSSRYPYWIWIGP